MIPPADPPTTAAPAAAYPGTHALDHAPRSPLQAPSRPQCRAPAQAWHLLAPIPVLLLSAGLLMKLHGDLWVADRVYALQGNSWALQDAWIAESLLHRGGRAASLAAWLAALLALAWTCASADHRAWRSPLAYLVAATLAATTAVAWLKHASPVSCPWDLVRYGGSQLQGDAWQAWAMGTTQGQCFPAGHASAGYAWVALCFAAVRSRPGLRWWGLGAGLLAGVVFGTAQQLRGAHFLSHDLAALAVCWSVAVALHLAWPSAAPGAAVNRIAPGQAA